MSIEFKMLSMALDGSNDNQSLVALRKLRSKVKESGGVAQVFMPADAGKTAVYETAPRSIKESQENRERLRDYYLAQLSTAREEKEKAQRSADRARKERDKARAELLDLQTQLAALKDAQEAPREPVERQAASSAPKARASSYAPQAITDGDPEAILFGGLDASDWRGCFALHRAAKANGFPGAANTLGYRAQALALGGLIEEKTDELGRRRWRLKER